MAALTPRRPFRSARLTAVAFKLVAAEARPKVSCLTLMDVYVDGCLGFVLLTTALVTALAAWVRLDLERFSIYSNPSAEA